ncbi:MAG: hypothetical protein AAF149_23840 [Bacteroidota bacterium]
MSYQQAVDIIESDLDFDHEILLKESYEDKYAKVDYLPDSKNYEKEG